MPSAIVLGAALALSLGAHAVGYGGLGALRALLARSGESRAGTSEIEFVLSDPPAEADPVDEAPDPETSVPTLPAPPAERVERARRERERHAEAPAPAPSPERETEREPEPEVAPAPTAPAPAPAELPPPSERAAVSQHSQDPDVPPPPDAEYIADENNTVEEETVATITSATHDDPDPSAGPPEDAIEAEVEGDAAESVAADMRESEGADDRRPTPEEAAREDPEDATDEPSTSRQPTADATGTDANDRGDQVEGGSPSRGDEGGARALGGAVPMTEVMVSDGFGSYTVRVPVGQPAGEGGGASGGRLRDGAGLGVAGRGPLLGHVGEEGGAPRERGTGDREGPRLGLTFTDLESVYGEEQIERERHARLERRRSHARGSSREEIWEHFRAAMENYIGEVRPGNQTALNAAASPFARFLHDMHVRIHQEFAERYLGSLGLDPPGGLNDESLHTTLEIAVNTDGSIFQVGILETSGNTLYDLGAFTAVWRAQPFPHPPSIILSGDGHAWLHWRFDRGPRHCGTWNAEPFLIDNGDTPPETGTDAVADEFLPDDAPPAQVPIEFSPTAPTVGTVP